MKNVFQIEMFSLLLDIFVWKDSDDEAWPVLVMKISFHLGEPILLIFLAVCAYITTVMHNPYTVILQLQCARETTIMYSI